MADASEPSLSRREFVQGTVSSVALAGTPAALLAAATGEHADKAAVLAQIPSRHAANVKRLQDWIALPSIAAENLNYPQGAQYMMKLAQDAGFSGVKLIPTSGKPGVFGTLDAGGGAGRAQEVRRGLHAGGGPGSRRRCAGVAGRQGRRGTRADLERREVGPGAHSRCALEPGGAGRFPELAPGAGTEHAGREG